MRSMRSAFIVAVIAAAVIAVPAQAGNPFAKSTTTADGYLTFDCRPDRHREGEPHRCRGLCRGPGHGTRAQLEGLLPGRPGGAGAGHRLRTSRIQFTQKKQGPLRPERRRRGSSSDGSYIGSRDVQPRHPRRVHDHRLQLPRATRTRRPASRCPRSRCGASRPRRRSSPSACSTTTRSRCPAAPTPRSSRAGELRHGRLGRGGHQPRHELKKGVLKDSPVVINMSLGGGRARRRPSQPPLDAAVAAGVVVVASAGNSGDARHGLPGRVRPGDLRRVGRLDRPVARRRPGQRRPRQRRPLPDVLAPERAAISSRRGHAPPPLFPAPRRRPRGGVVDRGPSWRTSAPAQKAGQQLDVLALGGRSRGPFAGDNNYNHLPWCVQGRRRPARPELRQLLLRRRHLDGVAARGGRRGADPREEPGPRAVQVQSILKGSARPSRPARRRSGTRSRSRTPRSRRSAGAPTRPAPASSRRMPRWRTRRLPIASAHRSGTRVAQAALVLCPGRVGRWGEGRRRCLAGRGGQDRDVGATARAARAERPGEAGSCIIRA